MCRGRADTKEKSFAGAAGEGEIAKRNPGGGNSVEGVVFLIEAGEHKCFWCPGMRLSQRVLPEYEGKRYDYYVCPDCGTGYIFTDTPTVFVMPAVHISAEHLWKLEMRYKRQMSKPGGSNSTGKRRKKPHKPLITERYRLE